MLNSALARMVPVVPLIWLSDQAQATFAQQVAGLAVGVGAHVGVDVGGQLRGDQALQDRQHLLRQGELDGNRVDLGHGEQALGVAHAQEVAFIHRANPDATGNRRANLGVRKLHLGRINRGLVALGRGLELVDQGLLLVIGLLGHAVVDAQFLVALEVDQRDLQLRLGFPPSCALAWSRLARIERSSMVASRSPAFTS